MKSHVRLSFLACVCSLISCGKKVVNGASGIEDRPPVLGAQTVSIQASRISSYSSSPGVLVFPRDGKIRFPEQVQVLEGNGANQKLRVYLNKVDQNFWEFHCDYQGQSIDDSPTVGSPDYLAGMNYYFEGCYDMNQNNLGLDADDLNDFTYPIDQGKILEVEVMGMHSEETLTTVEALFEIEWI